MIDNSVITLGLYNEVDITKQENMKKLKQQSDSFEAVVLNNLLKDSLKMKNELFPESPGEDIFNSMYKDEISKSLSGGFGYSELLFNYLKQKV
jgi:Rod binding domain-containing protein